MFFHEVIIMQIGSNELFVFVEKGQ